MPGFQLKDKRVDSVHSKNDGYVTLPNIFINFVTPDPPINPYYQQVRKESEEWVRTTLGYTQEEFRKPAACDFTLFAAIEFPTASLDKLRTRADWIQWVFEYDDQYDEGGEFKDDIDRAATEAKEMISVFRDCDDEFYRTKSSPLRQLWAAIFAPVKATATPVTLKRYVNANTTFINSVVAQVRKSSTPAWKSVEEYFELRLRTIGVRPGFVYSEFVYDLTLPEEILTNKHILELEESAALLIILHNDMLSHFEEGNDHLYNTVAILRKLQGLSIQEAFDLIEDKYLPETFARWELALAKLPSWGEGVDKQVQLYIRGIKDHVICNANWSFGSKRYFGNDGPEIKKTRRVQVSKYMK